MAEFLRAVAGSFIACFAFCFILNVRGRLLAAAPIGAVLCWLTYLAAGRFLGDFSCYFIATVVVSIYGEVMARVCRAPVTVFLLVGLLPLVPGGGIYYTMEYALQRDTTAFLNQLLTTFGIAGCLALGVLVVSSATRFFSILHYHKKVF